MPDPIDGNQINRQQFATTYGPGPTGTLVRRLLETLAGVKLSNGTLFFQQLFGPFKAFDDINQRWSCYSKFDWSLRQLPAISIYEGDPEIKQSDNGFLDGSLRLMVFWPASMRRPDLQQIPVLFKGAMQNFFTSQWCEGLLDPYPTLNLATKVPGLNRLGREITWSPNTEGKLGEDTVPVTILDVKYRIDLRRWNDYLVSQGMTPEDPFEVTLAAWAEISATYQGVVDGDQDPATQGMQDILDDITLENEG
jgi:hypothetical protein